MKPNRFLEMICELMSEEKLGEARRLLSNLQPTDLPRSEIVTASVYARRLGLPQEALRLLSPFVRPRKSVGHPTDEEKMEYAVTLSRLGILEEARELLAQIDRAKFPEVSLYEAFILITEWNYAAAIPVLERYLSSEGLTEPQKFLGELNLAACLVHSANWEKAEAQLKGLRAVADDRPGFKQARSNILDLSIHSALSQNQIERAEVLLQIAEKDAIEAVNESLALRKWRLVLELKRSRNDETCRNLEAFCGVLAANSHWELLRECQFYLAVETQNQELFHQVYFGSTNAYYRSWLMSESKNCFSVPEKFTMGRSGIGAKITLADSNGDESPNNSILWKLFQVLACESYRPMRITTLHHLLYPSEFFNPHSSPVRIRQTMKRLRKLLRESRIPARISFSKQGYRLVLGKDAAIVIPRELKTEAATEKKIGRLRLIMGDKLFAVKEASSSLGQSTRTVNRLLRQALEENVVGRHGDGPATRYYFR